MKGKYGERGRIVFLIKLLLLLLLLPSSTSIWDVFFLLLLLFLLLLFLLHPDPHFVFEFVFPPVLFPLIHLIFLVYDHLIPLLLGLPLFLSIHFIFPLFLFLFLLPLLFHSPSTLFPSFFSFSFSSCSPFSLLQLLSLSFHYIIFFHHPALSIHLTGSLLLLFVQLFLFLPALLVLLVYIILQFLISYRQTWLPETWNMERISDFGSVKCGTWSLSTSVCLY